jgi:signal transduction histidine kinase
MLFVTICDEGIGIPKEKQDKIFDKFYQCDESHKKQGSGLGLSIVKRILELLEGTIDLVSEEGKGTTMTVRIPAKQEKLLH